MRLIDADYLMCDIGCVNAVKYGNETVEDQHNSYSTLMMYEIADYINDAETVDAVEVVRCKDCEEYISLSEGDYFCGRVGSYFGNTKPDDFCSRGVRKMNAEVEE